jgi:surfactin synthase thioesterase subunit
MPGLSLHINPASAKGRETDDQPPRPLDIPLTVISGRRDSAVVSSELTGWREWSCRPVQYETVDAEHFSYRSQPQDYFGVITKHLLGKSV